MPTDLPELDPMPQPEPKPGAPRRGAASEEAGAFLIARVAGIPIRIHFTFLLLLAWFAFAGAVGDRKSALMSLLFVAALFACVALHELGHALAAMRTGYKTRSITLYPIGGVARMEKAPSPLDELPIAAAGPAVNLGIALLLILVMQWLRMPVHSFNIDQSSGSFLSDMMWANVTLAVFNLLPAFPMDGGRILRSLLARITDPTTATALAARIGQLIAVAMGVFAVFSGLFMLLIIAVLVYFGARQEAVAYQTKSLITGHTVREAMLRDFRTLTVGATLKEAADTLIAGSQQDFPVVYGDEVVGVLSRAALMRGLAAAGPDAYVAGAMERQYAWVLPDEDLESVLSRFQGAVGPILVMGQATRETSGLLGMVTQENLLEFLALTQLRNRMGY